MCMILLDFHFVFKKLIALHKTKKILKQLLINLAAKLNII